MRICVYGAGAIGGLMAAWLARSGQDVSVVARGAQLQAIQHHGLRVRSKGEVESFRIKAEADPAKLGTQDYVLVTVKAQSLTHVAESISPLLDKDTSVVTAMNGVPWWFFDRLKFGNGRERLESLDPGGRLSRAMPTGRIVGCVIHLAASTPGPGLISHNMGKRLILGEPGGTNTGRTRRIAEALAGAGFEAVTSEFIEKEFWVKLLGNVSFNPVSALTMTTADRLIEDQEITAYMVQIMREVLAIGRAVGVDAYRAADGQHLAHDLHHVGRDLLVLDQPVGRRHGQRRHRIEADVAQQLHPELLFDELARYGLESRRRQRLGNAPGAGGVRAAGLAEDQALAHVVADEPRLGSRGGEVDHAADDAAGRHGAREPAAGIERLQALAAVAEFQAVEKPPRHAVHRRDDRGVFVEQR